MLGLNGLGGGLVIVGLVFIATGDYRSGGLMAAIGFALFAVSIVCALIRKNVW